MRHHLWWAQTSLYKRQSLFFYQNQRTIKSHFAHLHNWNLVSQELFIFWYLFQKGKSSNQIFVSITHLLTLAQTVSACGCTNISPEQTKFKKQFIDSASVILLTTRASFGKKEYILSNILWYRSPPGILWPNNYQYKYQNWYQDIISINLLGNTLRCRNPPGSPWLNK